MLIVSQYEPAGHSLMTVDEQKKPAEHGVAALRPAALHSWPLGHGVAAARPVDGQYEPSVHSCMAVAEPNEPAGMATRALPPVHVKPAPHAVAVCMLGFGQ